MKTPRPNLDKLEPEVRQYIEMLEAELEELRQGGASMSLDESTHHATEEQAVEFFTEEPTTISILTATANGITKRTLRHLYSRQRRGGMGIFDLDTSIEDPPVVLATIDQNQTLLVFTSLGRVFRLPSSAIPETPVRGRGESIMSRLNLQNGETLACILPEQSQGYLALLSQYGFVRLLRHHVFGEYMKPGMNLFDTRIHGALTAVTWTPGDGDLFIATRGSKAIRFSEKLIPPAGTSGIRLDTGDACVAITAVDDQSQVFLLGEDGKGTIRRMENFNANKAPGAGGKKALNTDQLVAARTVTDNDDILIISRLSKIIRFSAEEVPVKDGVVQGVVCMNLRADSPVALTTSSVR